MMCSCWARANGKQLLLAMLAVTVFVFIYAMLLHGMILEFTYQATAQLWRTEADMQANMLADVGSRATYVAMRKPNE